MTMKSRYAFFTITTVLLIFLQAACGVGLRTDPLNGTAWILTYYDNTPPLMGTILTVEFNDGQIGGSSGCNSYGGTYKIKGEKITTDSIAMTLMACVDPGVMEQEQTFLDYLQNAQIFKLRSGQLQIFQSEGKALIFVPKK